MAAHILGPRASTANNTLRDQVSASSDTARMWAGLGLGLASVSGAWTHPLMITIANPLCASPASVASPIRCRRLRAAIGAQRKAHRAAHTELYWQAMQRRDALRWPAQTDR
ncbi:hypothetical protein Veis_1082 [Verminephrobacter eiseniae EF01-2]|uniref:Uncharacterized protein n=1 Tax=Verminephrobacter eiseniae (strain EF01-2) TaxID=391735 RepID=A1WGV1_VEREI|nr:hypothetical protein Veis_1082 [Verminephrobacter eiseniae EF01-2]